MNQTTKPAACPDSVRVERIQISHGRAIRVVSVFRKRKSDSGRKLRVLAALELQRKKSAQGQTSRAAWSIVCSQCSERFDLKEDRQHVKPEENRPLLPAQSGRRLRWRFQQHPEPRRNLSRGLSVKVTNCSIIMYSHIIFFSSFSVPKQMFPESWSS